MEPEPSNENNNGNDNIDDDNIPLLTMSLELDNGMTEQINIYRNSDPEMLALEFCREHNLEFDSVNYLKEQIQKLLSETKEIEEEEEEVEEQIEEVYEDEGTDENRLVSQEPEVKEGDVEGSDAMKRREEEIHQLTENNQIDDDIEICEEEDEEGNEEVVEIKEGQDVQQEQNNETHNDDDNEQEQIVNDDNDNDNANITIPENPEDEKDAQEEGEAHIEHDANNNNGGGGTGNKEEPLKIEDLLHTVKNEYQHPANLQDNVHHEHTHKPLTNHTNKLEYQQPLHHSTQQQEPYEIIKEHEDETNSLHKDDDIDIQDIEDNEDHYADNNVHDFQESQPKEIEDEDYANINEDDVLQSNNYNPSLTSNTNVMVEESKPTSQEQNVPQQLHIPLSTDSNDNNNIHSLPDQSPSPSTSPPQQNHPQTSNVKELTSNVHQYKPPQDSLENIEQDDELPITQDNNYDQPHRHTEEEEEEEEMIHNTQPLHQMEEALNHIPSGNSHHTASNTVKHNNNIFDRLFQEAEIKRVMPKRPCHFNNRNNNANNSLSKYNSNSNNTNISGNQVNSSGSGTKLKKQTNATNTVTNASSKANNYGEYLYEQHKLHKQDKMHRNEEDKRESQNKELVQCTFKPNINNNEAITSSNNINNYNYYYNGKQVQTIGTNNNSIRPRTPMTRAEKLEKEFNEKYTFKPQINSGYTTELNFLERQALHMQKCKDNIRNYKQMLQQQQQIDNEQRKCRSKPRTPCHTAYPAKGNEYNSNTFGNTNVFDRNYNYANQYKKKLIELTNMYNNNNICNHKTNPNMTNTQFNVNNQTNKIIDRVNCEAFSNLFRVLDSDEDGVISQMHMNTKKLSPEIYRIIEPILNEIKEENQKLEESDFVDAMCNLYDDIRYYDRHLLINTFKNIKNTKIKQDTTNTAFNRGYKGTANTKCNHPRTQKDVHVVCDNAGKPNDGKKCNVNYSFKPVINANANRFAKRYDEKQKQMFNKYLSLYNGSNKFNSNRDKAYINRAEYFKDNNNNANFNSLRKHI